MPFEVSHALTVPMASSKDNALANTLIGDCSTRATSRLLASGRGGILRKLPSSDGASRRPVATKAGRAHSLCQW